MSSGMGDGKTSLSISAGQAAVSQVAVNKAITSLNRSQVMHKAVGDIFKILARFPESQHKAILLIAQDMLNVSEGLDGESSEGETDSESVNGQGT